MNEKINCSFFSCNREAWRPIDGEKPLCIFHSDKIEEKKEYFKKAWEEYRKTTDEINRDYQCIIFPININFSGMKFNYQTSFNNAEFKCNADFKDAIFYNYSSFRNVKFSGETNFNRVEFTDYVYFDTAEFSGKATFYKTQFNKGGSFNDVSFIGADLSGSSFTNCTFANVKYNLKPNEWKKPEKWWQFWKYRKLEKPIPPTNFTGIETKGSLLHQTASLSGILKINSFSTNLKNAIINCINYGCGAVTADAASFDGLLCVLFLLSLLD